ncbi:hypothetical protein TrRE_jg4620, partial [Triparma retinervis]
MFGDTFGTKSDYVKGLEYQMRRAYMGDDPGEVVSTPPDTMFLSRDQARKIHTNPEIEAANLNNVLSFNSPTKKKKKKKKKKKSSPKGAKKHAFFVSDDVSDYESDSSEEEPQKNPMAALLAGRMATSPTSKKQLLKETAKRNAERKAAREQLKDAPALADIWELVSEAGVS